MRDSLASSQPETPGTTPVHIVLQVAESLAMIHEEGLPAVYARHEAMARSSSRRARSRWTSGCSFPTSTALTDAHRAPNPGRRVAEAFARTGLERRGILVAEGLGPYSGHCIRIGHMGDIRVSDVDRTCDAIQAVLAEAR